MKKVYFLLMTAFLMSITVWSKTTRWDGGTSNEWTNPTNWTNGVPASGDSVIFPTNITATITRVANDGNLSLNWLRIVGNSSITLQASALRTITIANGVTGNDFIVDQSAQLTLSTNVDILLVAVANANIAGRLNVNTNRTYTTNGITTISANTGILNNTGTVTSPAITNLVFQNNATYFHARDGGIIPLATWNAGSNFNITGVNGIAPTGLGQNFGNFEWNTAQTADLDLNGSLKNVAGDLIISKTSGDATPRLLNLSSATNYTLTIGGNFIIKRTPAAATTNVYFVNDGNGDAIINIAGDYLHQGGNLVFVDVNADANDGTAIMNVGKNLEISGGDIDFTSGVDGPPGRKGSMTIRGNFSQSMGGTIRSTIEDVDIPNGLITFNKPGIQTFTAVAPANITYTNFIIAAGSTLRLQSGLAINRDTEPNFIGKFTVSSGAILNAASFAITSQLDPDVPDPGDAFANFELLANGKIITAHAAGVQGSVRTINNLVASFSSDADYEFRGASTGVFTTTTPNTIRDLIINRATGNVLLSMPINIKRTLNLTDGLLTTTNTNLPTITATGTATPATDTSFVNGPLAKAGTAAFTFPVGKSGAGFRNIGITAPSGSATFRAEFFRAPPSAGTFEPSLKRVSSCEYWGLSKTAGTADVSANVVLSWETNSSCTSAAYVTDPTTLRVAHLLAGVWIDEGRLSSTGNNSAGTVTSSDAPSTFSPFALGSISATENPLPVVFANVKAYEKNNGVQIEWSNMTEKDVAVYTIERSANGIDFSAIGQQSPTSNQNDKADYNAFDANPNSGVSYYRIKAEETTGKIVYSKVLSVDLGNSIVGLSLYPNPVTGNQVTISLSNIRAGHYSLRVINNAGQDIYRQTIINQGRNLTQALDLPLAIKPGVYNMVITGDGYRENKMFIVK